MDRVNGLVGKKVLFVDLETTGFPHFKGNMPGGYHDYKDNSKYSGSRIVQFGWCYYDCFSLDFDVDCDAVKSVLRKPWDFYEINQEVVDVHGITYENIVKNGTLIKKILKGEFGNCVNECDFIVAYNVYFDFSILANEIHRTKNTEMYEKIIKMKENNVICMMEITKLYLGHRCSQVKAYEKLLGKEPTQQHDAKGDVIAMLEILKHMTSNLGGFNKTPNQQSCSGKKWTKTEESDLMDLYAIQNKSIKDIAQIHKRTDGAIRSRLDKLCILKKEDVIENDTISNKNSNNGKKWTQKEENVTIFDKIPINSSNNGKKWTRKEEGDMIDAYINQNKSILDISDKHKRSCTAIQSHLKQFNLLKKEDIGNRLFAVSIICSPTQIINGKMWNAYTHQEQILIFAQNDFVYKQKSNDIRLDKSLTTKSNALIPQMCYQAIFNTSENSIKFYKELMDKIYSSDMKVTEIFNYEQWTYYKQWMKSNCDASQKRDGVSVKVIKKPKDTIDYEEIYLL